MHVHVHVYVSVTQHDVLGVRGGGEGEKWGKWRRGRLVSDSPHDMFCIVHAILKRPALEILPLTNYTCILEVILHQENVEVRGFWRGKLRQSHPT